MFANQTTSASPGASIGERGRSNVWIQYRTAVFAVCITLLGGGLRLFHAGAESLRLDEVWTLWLARQDMGEVTKKILFEGVDSTPPTYYLLVHPLLLLSQDPISLRLVTVVAGTLTVLVAFRLALFLFDLRVAALSGLLVAIAPMHIEYSQVARAYILSSFCALCSAYCFARLLFSKPGRRDWALFVLATVATLLTFYLSVLVVLTENIVILYLQFRKRLSGGMFKRWIFSQIAVLLSVVPVSFAIFINIGPDTGHSWLAHPNLLSLAKTAILFITGDPSVGPAAVTPARAISLLVVGVICSLGVWLWLRKRYTPADSDGPKVSFLLSVVAIPLLLSFIVSQKSSIYHEKYLLYIIPCLLMLVAWVLVRSSRLIASRVTLLLLLTLTATSLVVYYSAPTGEQWREAVGYMVPLLRGGDTVFISPGYYAFPFAYYAYGSFPGDIRALAHKSVVQVKNGKFTGMDLSKGASTARPAAIPSLGRIWVVSGYTPPDISLAERLRGNFTLINMVKLTGAQVSLMQPANH